MVITSTKMRYKKVTDKWWLFFRDSDYRQIYYNKFKINLIYLFHFTEFNVCVVFEDKHEDKGGRIPDK